MVRYREAGVLVWIRSGIESAPGDISEMPPKAPAEHMRVGVGVAGVPRPVLVEQAVEGEVMLLLLQLLLLCQGVRGEAGLHEKLVHRLLLLLGLLLLLELLLQ